MLGFINMVLTNPPGLGIFGLKYFSIFLNIIILFLCLGRDLRACMPHFFKFVDSYLIVAFDLGSVYFNF